MRAYRTTKEADSTDISIPYSKLEKEDFDHNMTTSTTQGKVKGN
jgi:hypothetical protein